VCECVCVRVCVCVPLSVHLYVVRFVLVNVLLTVPFMCRIGGGRK